MLLEVHEVSVEKPCVLVVGSVTSRVTHIFSSCEFDVLVAPSFEDAWRTLSSNSTIALAIVNLDGGDDFLNKLRTRHSSCSRVLCVPDHDSNKMLAAIKLARPHYVLSDINEIEASLQMIVGLVEESQQNTSHHESKTFSKIKDHAESSIPTLHSQLPLLVQTLEDDQHLACLYIDLSRLRPIEQEFGIALHSDLFSRAGSALQDLRGSKLRKKDLICRTGDSDGYIVFTGPSRYGDNESLKFETLAARINTFLNEELTNAMRGLTRIMPQVTIGAARILENPMIRSERLVMRLVNEAKSDAELSWKANKRVRKSELQDLIIQKRLRPVFQPIVDMDTADIFAFEALTRGPEDSLLESPVELFAVAKAVDLTLELDRACFRSALVAANGCEPIHRLFVNLLPQSFHDERFIAEEVSSLLEAASLTPANLVFEITEKLAIDNFSAFKQALGRYTDMGFGVAVDDVGTQHSNLESLMALQPHFIKLSDILCRGVSKSTVKREMVRSLQRIAETIDAVTVAEGIEDIEDFRALRDLGIRFGQGYYFCRPQPGFSKIADQAVEDAKLLAPRQINGVIGTPGPHDEFSEQTIPHLSLNKVPADPNTWAPSAKRQDQTEPFALNNSYSEEQKSSSKDK